MQRLHANVNDAAEFVLDDAENTTVLVKSLMTTMPFITSSRAGAVLAGATDDSSEGVILEAEPTG